LAGGEYGGAGVDQIYGRGGERPSSTAAATMSIINTGSGNDLVFAQTGNDLVFHADW
jgi:hypothetical protein